MPLVKINILNIWDSKEIEQLNDAIHSALVKILKIPETDYNQRVYAFDKENWKRPPNKSDKYVLLELYLFPGRKKETKKQLYIEIVNGLEKLGIPKNDILILIIEQPLSHWGIRGGIPADEIDLGYNTNV